MTPKFRAWDVHNKKMFTESELVIWHGNVYASDYQKLFKKLIEGARGLVGYSIDDKYLMKSTGLFDKNRVEIFDKDIIKNKDGRLAIVKWHGTYASFVYVWLDELDKNKQDWQPLFLAYMKFEVVGNIYKNFDLLEG